MKSIKLNISNHLWEFKDILLSLKKLHYMCNQQFLPHNYQQIIDEFRSAWYRLADEHAVRTTPTIHILLDHLEDYFDYTDATLIKTIDELCESIHQFLNKWLMRSFYHVKYISNSNHSHRLFSAVRHFNSYNLRIYK